MLCEMIHQRRIPEPALCCDDCAVDVAVAGIHYALQGIDNRLQEGITIARSQWAGCC
jgi:hypothetical protein